MSSQSFRENLFSEANGDVVVFLMTITHPQLSEVIRISSDNAHLLNFEEQLRGTISRGQQFSFMPVDLQLPEQGDEVSPVITVTIYDIASTVSPLLERTVTPAFVTVEIVAASAPDIVEVQFAVFRLTSADIQGDNVSLQLSIDAMGDESYPADNFTPSSFPGLWSTY